MKKISILLLSLIIFSGCNMKMDNTPTSKVEAYFSKYQTLDKSVLDDLDKVIAEEEKFDTKGREQYREVIKDQYKNLEYKIKNEIIDGDKATVTVEITVKDFTNILKEAEIYKSEHPEEFNNDSLIYDETLYTKYVISKLKDAKDKIKYTLQLDLTKTDEQWELDELDTEEKDKILGIYTE